jgi:hypothetical protein
MKFLLLNLFAASIMVAIFLVVRLVFRDKPRKRHELKAR